MNQAEYYKRVEALLRPQELAGKEVAVLGVGSGGCRLARSLGQLGVGLLLVELPGERLAEHNIVRHILGYESLGKPKHTEMARHIHNLNPATSVRTADLDVATQAAALEELFCQRRPDLLAVCVDNEAARHAINQTAQRLRLPQIGAGVYDGGVEGEVYASRPGQACYACLAAFLGRTREPLRRRQAVDYNSLNTRQIQSTCALGLDIEQIALLQTRWALHLLLGEGPAFLGTPPQANLWVFANRVVPGVFDRPAQCEFYVVPRQPHCLVCGASPNGADRIGRQALAGLGIEA